MMQSLQAFFQSREQWKWYVLSLVLLLLPYAVKPCSIAIIVFVFLWLIEGGYRKKFEQLKSSKILWSYLLFYVLHVVWMLGTENTKAGGFELEKKLSLLLFPLVIGTSNYNYKTLRFLLWTFVISCLCVTIVCFVASYGKYLETGNADYFILDKLTAVLRLHRVYFSLYLLFSIYILGFFLYTNKYRVQTILLLSLLVVYFIVFILLLSSRMTLISLLLSFVGFAAVYSIKTRKIVGALLLLTFGIGLSFMVVISNERIRNVVRETYSDLDKGNSEINTTGPNLRIIIWKSSLDILKIKFITGVGTGDVDDALYQQYLKRNFIWGVKDRYNAHNQFLQTGIGLGIIGLASLLFCLVFPLLKNKDMVVLLHTSFVLAFCLSCLTEAMLCTQKGVVFFAIFHSLLGFYNSAKEKEHARIL